MIEIEDQIEYDPGLPELPELTNRFEFDLKAKPVMDKRRAERLLGNGFLL
jgi:hypothetical protein